MREPDVNNCLIQAALKVLRLTAGVEAGVQLKSPGESYRPYGDLSSHIVLTGDLTGIIVVSMSHGTATFLASQVAGVEASALSASDIEEVVTEIVNQVSGICRTDLSKIGAQVTPSLPELVRSSMEPPTDESDVSWGAFELIFDNHTILLQSSLGRALPVTKS